MPERPDLAAMVQRGLTPPRNAATHTPGPWHADAGGSRITSPRTGVVLAEAFPPAAYDPDSRQRLANAALIAAAPDLLAAAEGMVNADWSDKVELRHWREQLIAVIAKAKGKS